MKRLMLSLAVSTAIAGGMMACGGKGSSGPSGPSDANTTTSPFSPTPASAGQASDLDIARLASRFGAIAAQVLQQTLPASSGAAGLSAGQAGVGAVVAGATRALGVPASTSSVGALFLCCSDLATTSLRVTGSLGDGGSGAVPVALTYSTDGPLQWTGASGGPAWELTFQTGTLTLSGTLTAANGTVGPNQQLTLTGGLEYAVAGAPNKFILPVALTFTYPDLNIPATTDTGSSVPPTASGTVGSLQIPGTALPTVIMTGRCSAPQEGCGPLVQGQCPCTKWPPCPSYGLSCPGTFR